MGFFKELRDHLKESRPSTMDQIRGTGRAIRKGGLAGGMSPLAIRREAKQVKRERMASQPKPSTAFKSEIRDDGKESILFNRKGDGPKHGHVVRDPKTGETIFARDEDDNVYIDKRD